MGRPIVVLIGASDTPEVGAARPATRRAQGIRPDDVMVGLG